MLSVLRSFSTKPKIGMKIDYGNNGEKLILRWGGVSKFLKLGSLCSIGYLYFLFQLDSNTLLGAYAKYNLPLFGVATFVMFHRFSKFLHRLILLEGGNVVRFEKYPFGGWGHYNKILIDITCIEGLIPYGTKRWYNPLRIGRGFYKLKYEKKVFGKTMHDYVIFKISEDYEKELFKIIIVGKPVNEQNLRMLKNFNK